MIYLKFLEEEFYKTYNELRKTTELLSYHDTKNPLFQKIIKMGQEIIPLLIKNPSWWSFKALAHLAGERPFGEEDAGKFDVIREAWYKWGKDKGYI